MRLRSLDPPLDEDLIVALEACNIKTDAELIFFGTPTDIWLKLPSDTVSLKELNGIIKGTTAKLSASAHTGLDSLELLDKRREKFAAVELSTGIRALDDLVGGFGYQHVLEISGDRGSGKTTLALQIVLRQLARYPESSAVWIDTTGDTSADRIASMLKSFGDQEDVDTALQRLQITRAFDVDAMEAALDELRASFMTGLDVGQPVLRTVVIDSITPLFRPLLSAVTSQGHATMVSVMRQLRIYAETASLTFLVLNGTSAAFPTKPNTAAAFMSRKPALGPSFTYTSDVTLWLSKQTIEFEHAAESQSEDTGEDLYVAETLRSKCTPSGTRCSLKLKNGIFTDA